MHPRQFALFAGIVFLALGILGFMNGLVTMPWVADPVLQVESNYGRLFNLFPVNTVLNIIFLLIGISGIAAYANRFRSLPASINYSRGLFAILGAMSILGMINGTSTLFGYVPLFGNNIWLHGFMSLAGAYFGFRLPAEVKDVRMDVPKHEHLQQT